MSKSNENLEKLKSKRKTERSNTTKLFTKIETALCNENADCAELDEHLAVLMERANNLKLLDSNIESLIDASLIEEESNISDEYQEKCTRFAHKIRRFLNQAETLKFSSTEVRSGISSNVIEGLNVSHSVKLPKLVIQPFSGDPKLWNEFWNSFDSTINQNDSISKVEKFAYLKSYLSGSALSVVSGFELNDSNYDSCIKLIQERFGRKDLIVSSFMNKILNLQSVKYSTHVTALRRLYDELDISIRNLDSMQVNSENYGPLLIPILLKLLPEDLVLDYKRERKSKENDDVLELLSFLKREIECRESVYLSLNEKRQMPPNQRNQQNKFVNKDFKTNVPSATALNAQMASICIFCSANHDPFKCNLPAQKKWEVLRNNKRCYKCFKLFHSSFNCRIIRVPCRKCKNPHHHFSICMGKQNLRRTETHATNIANEINGSSEWQSDALEGADKVTSASNSEVINSVPQCYAGINRSKNVYLQICTAIATSKFGHKLSRIMLDNGSSRSFCTENIANSLKLKPIRYESLSIFSFGMKRTIEKLYPIVEFELMSRDGNFKTKIQTLVVPEITGATISSPDCHVRNFMNKHKLQLADSFPGNEESAIEILIGSDLFWDFILEERMTINKNVGAVNSVFGWVIYGSSFMRPDSCLQNMAVMNNIVLNNDLTDFWRLDSLGIVESQEMSCKDKQMIEQFESELVFKNGRYETKLLWNSDPSELDSNFFIAEKRLKNLKNKLNADKEIYREYKNIINEQLSDGIIEECTENKWDDGYFMPHRAVVRPDKRTSRVRIVFDASSKANNCRSLNDLLLAGPNLNPNILDIILKFRKYEVAFSADIEKAFLMIGIAEESRKYLKFLWFDDFERETIKVLNMTRVTFGITSSPFVLAATIKCHLKKYVEEYPETYNMLNSSLYVDDLYFGANCVEDAYRLSSSAAFILKDAGMKLRKFNSNSVELKNIWTKNLFENESLAQTKVLGLLWNTNEDIIKVDLLELLNYSLDMKSVTKRVILTIAAKMYDPAGFVTPFLVRIKILMQKIWILGLDWDDDLPQEIKTEFLTWYSELSILQSISIPRNYFPNCDILNSDISLHVFCDSSQKAYGAVAYFRFINKLDEIKTVFICSKSRIAPLKTLSLPRLELMGAVIASRMSKYLHELFGDVIKNTFLWTDSQIVLCWIRGSSKDWKPFVCNRVAEIHEATSPSSWRFCRGKENPADLLTRGIDGTSLLNNPLWWFGPPWLQESSSNWPFLQSIEIKNETELERRKVAISSTCVIKKSDPIVDFKRYNSLLKLFRVIAWICRFLSKARKLSVRSGPLDADEIRQAEMICIREVQLEYFSSEIGALKSSKFIPETSNIFSLAPFLDGNQILRIRSRLEDSEFIFTEKHPILLPRDAWLTEMIVRHEHNKVLHAGVAATLTKVREKYWTPKGRQLVKKIINNCLVCRKFSARPASQMTGQLPKDRIAEAPPFSVTGVDFTGPVFVKLGNEVQKSYITLFTCAITRSIHLELVSDMSAQKFILALKRFISRRGNCKIFYSDNAKTFKNVSKDIQRFVDIIRKSEFQNFLASEGISWKFIVELAPWWGGFYERMMRSIKEPLKKILGRAQLSFEEIMTILAEIENILNQRPLTYIYNELSEPEPLSPAHFLLAGRKIENPFYFSEILIAGTTKTTRETLLRRKRYQTVLLRQVWTKWKNEYMLSLRNFHFFGTPHAKQDISVDDVVLVEGSQKSKFLWDLGRITEVFKGRDGLVRSCIVKTKRGLFRRPIQLIYPLELSD